MVKRSLLVLALALAVGPALAAPAERGWVGSWAGSPAAQPSTAAAPLKPLVRQTVRQRIRLSLGGRRLRVTLTNAYGATPLRVGAASVALSKDGVIDPASFRPLTFAGKASASAAPGAPLVADPVELSAAAGQEVSVSLYLPEETLPSTYNRSIGAVDLVGTALAPRAPDAVVSPEGDFTRRADIPGATAGPRLFVSRVDVLAPNAAGAVVVLGTTRTVGDGRWPDILAERLKGSRAVVNASMVANPLTRGYPGGGEAALARFDRDVLMTPGVSHLIIADAINDIGQARGVAPDAPIPTVEELAAAYLQMTARARARGVKVIATTLLPFAGVPFNGFYSEEKEAIRQGLNRWILTSGAFDGVIDMDAVLRDPADPHRYAPGTEASNHFAPNEVGERKLGAAIDLKLFR